MKLSIVCLVSLLLVLALAVPVYAQDPVEDTGTHSRLDLVNTNLSSIDGELVTVNSNLVGLHNDLITLQQSQAAFSSTLGLIDLRLVSILSATLALSDSLSMAESSLVTPTGYITAPQSVVYRYEYTSGDRQIVILLVLLTVLQVARMLFAALRGTNL